MTDEAATGPATGVETETSATTTQDQQGTESWLDSLPEEYRADPSLKTVPDVSTLAKNYIEQAKVIGRKGLIPPGDNDPPEMYDKFYNSLGRPEAPDKYEFARPEMPEGLNYSEDFEQSYRDMAHKLGITQKQAKGLYEWFVPLTMQGAEASREQVTKAEQELKDQWGDKYEGNLKEVQTAFRKLADPEDYEAMESSGFGNHPGMVRLMLKVARAMREDSMVSGKGSQELSVQQQIDELERNPALFDPKSPDQKGLQKKREALYQKLYPESGA